MSEFERKRKKQENLSRGGVDFIAFNNFEKVPRHFCVGK